MKRKRKPAGNVLPSDGGVLYCKAAGLFGCCIKPGGGTIMKRRRQPLREPDETAPRGGAKRGYDYVQTSGRCRRRQ